VRLFGSELGASSSEAWEGGLLRGYYSRAHEAERCPSEIPIGGSIGRRVRFWPGSTNNLVSWRARSGASNDKI